jgi:hypothetical protein
VLEILCFTINNDCPFSCDPEIFRMEACRVYFLFSFFLEEVGVKQRERETVFNNNFSILCTFFFKMVLDLKKSENNLNKRGQEYT